MTRFARALRRRSGDEVRAEIVEEARVDELAEWRAASAAQPRKNAYYCEACSGYVITIDRDPGVTPMFLACRVLGDPHDPANTCKGRSRSLMYPPEPWPTHDGHGEPIPTEPTWEWYMPDEDELASLRRHNPGTYEHVAQGGLLLRKLDDGE